MPNNIYNNLSEKQLKAGYWYVTHRVLLRKIFILALACVSLGLLFYGALGLINYYVLGRGERAALEADIAATKLNQNLLAELSTPQQLQVLDTTVLKTGVDSYDFVTEVVNPNGQWAARSFDYSYLLDNGDKTNVKSDFILPNQDKFVLYLNYKSTQSAGTANIVIENIKWEKESGYDIKAEKFLQFEFAGAVALASSESGLGAEEEIGGLRFDAINKSAYNFWEPRFIVLLYKQNSLVGATQVVLDKIDAGEKKSVSLNLFQGVPRNVEIKIFPDINILDEKVFKGFSVDSGELK